MRSSNTSPDNLVIDAEVLAIHVMRTLSRAQQNGEQLSLEDLAARLEVRKIDVRRVVSALDKRGFVDAMRMRVTMMGFVLGCSVGSSELKPARRMEIRAQMRAAA
jgi:hypothetical protein